MTGAGDGEQCLVHTVFRRQVDTAGDRPALEFGAVRMTYSELDGRAAEVSAALRAFVDRPNVLVATYLPRGPELVAAYLGILAAGAAYVPLDPSQPHAWNLDRIRTAAARVVVTDRAHRQLFDDAVTVVTMDDLPAAGAAPEAAVTPGPADLAYVMFTSGSTGNPKAVAVPHRAVVGLVCGQDYLAMGPDQCQLLHSPHTFDASTFEIWGSLLTGGRLAIAPPGPRTGTDFARLITEHGVTTAFFTTALFRVLLEEQPRALALLHQVIFGGEAVYPELLRDARMTLPDTKLVAAYGPTETTTFATTYHGPVPAAAVLGTALRGMATYILDADLEPVADGAAGELCIAGSGLAAGYLGAPDLTADRFVPDPFAAQPGSRLYRTGDEVRRTGTGPIEFVGRLDSQLKIRGRRIEPAEVERALLRHAGVRAAYVTAEQNSTRGRYLAAYVTVATDTELGEADLRCHMEATVPDQLRPDVYVLRSAVRLTPHGKLERRRQLDGVAPAPRHQQYHVVRNALGQCAFWPAGRSIPQGWAHAGRSGTLEQCGSYVREVWPDILRPADSEALKP
ncbi:MAG: amino acid adenylation domain-containing protein [Mycobacteriaceae bacterium]|nr:amino acid adenylation domain-containing protein [Mycobacteriaceae bacterium]